METQTAFVGTDGAVELHAVAQVGLNVPFVINPRDAEREDTVGLDDTLHDLGLLEFGVLVVDTLDGFEDFAHGLQVLALARVLALQVGHQIVYIHSYGCFR